MRFMDNGGHEKPKEREPYHCPICGEVGDPIIERINIGETIHYQNVVFDTKAIYACPKCHNLFWGGGIR